MEWHESVYLLHLGNLEKQEKPASLGEGRVLFPVSTQGLEVKG
jgi:hypothetical protein